MTGPWELWREILSLDCSNLFILGGIDLWLLVDVTIVIDQERILTAQTMKNESLFEVTLVTILARTCTKVTRVINKTLPAVMRDLSKVFTYLDC